MHGYSVFDYLRLLLQAFPPALSVILSTFLCEHRARISAMANSKPLKCDSSL